MFAEFCFLLWGGSRKASLVGVVEGMLPWVALVGPDRGCSWEGSVESVAQGDG